MEYYNKERLEVLPFVPIHAKRILDIGCGSGNFAQQIKNRQNVQIWGVELHTPSANIARHIVDKIFINDIWRVIDEIPDNHFDCIVCNDVLEHLYDPYTLLYKLKFKLSEDGVIVSSIPNVRYFKVLYRLIILKKWDYQDYGVLDRTHLRFFTCDNIIELFENNGYKVTCIKGINPTKSWFYKVVNALALNFFWDSGFIQFVCVAKVK